MKENKHTPGPWVFDERRNQICSAHPDFNNSLIAKIATGEDLREEHANAQLVASAPELLGALENIVRDYGLDGTVMDGNWELARQAIAKAKGGV